MLMLPASVRIFVCCEPTDMRRSFDGLSLLAEAVVGHSPLSGHLFVFRNRRGDRLKILWWDRDGYAIWSKRLEQGVFRFPESNDKRIEMSAGDLAMILEGVDLASVKRIKRYKHTVCA
jgi:transposase